MRQNIILFDINETVLNLHSLKPKFKAVFGDDQVVDTWFSMLLHSSTVCFATGVKTNFFALAGIALDSIAARRGIKLTEETHHNILSTFANLPAHPDIKESLEMLRAAGFHTVAFSNSSLKLVASQIKNAGLLEYFDDIISVEETGSFKPDINVYLFAAKKLNVPLSALRLVAAHDWDTHGALAAGMKAAYINRSDADYNPLYLKAGINCTNMQDIVKHIIETDS